MDAYAVLYTALVGSSDLPHESPDKERVSGRLSLKVRRAWQRLRRRWCVQPVRFIYHDAYSKGLGGAPLDPMRGQKILGFLIDEGLLDRDDISVPRRPAVRGLLRVHDADYIDSIGRNPEVAERIFGERVGHPEIEQLVEMQRMGVGGTIQATRLALHGRSVAVNLGGGYHHACRDCGMGFCIFNDIAIAVARLRAKGFSEPVLVIDLDLHDGNGTRSIFAHDSTVHTYSVHNEHWGDIEAQASTSIALGADVSDEIYLGTLLKTLPDVLSEVRPGLVIYVAGTDPAGDDQMGNWNISADGMIRRDHLVVELLRRRRRRIPLVVLLAGGYGSNTWRYSARFLAWLVGGRTIEPPNDAEMILRRYRKIRGSIDPASLTAEPTDFSWKLSDDDLIGILPDAPKRSRFLSHFSAHGIELLLERFGLLDQLRLRGFRHPTLEVDLTGSVGDTLRVFSEPDHKELLMEFRASRSSRAVSGFEVLVAEWLLLQNPRAHFGPYRQPLPGQKHPGLGLLKEFFSWLVVVAEILELDGIYWMPSSYHVAVQSRRSVRFLDPQGEAIARALEKLFSGMSLASASRAVDSGRVFDEITGQPFEWRGFPMVLPVSEALRDMVGGEDYERRAEEAEADLRLALRPAPDDEDPDA